MGDQTSPPLRHVAVIGGGIAGLATAFRLQQAARASGPPLRFTLFEGSPSLGGKIVSEAAGGFVIEGGPDSFLQQKPEALELALELGLEPELMGANPGQKQLYTVLRGRLTPMPAGMNFIIPTRWQPFATSPLLSWPGKIRLGLDLIIPARKIDGDESVADFIRRRMGSEALEAIAEPLMAGIHVADPERQSLLATFPRYRAIERQYGSLIRGTLAQIHAVCRDGKKKPSPTPGAWRNSAFLTFRAGMGTLVGALAGALSGGQILTGRPVTQIRPEAGGGYRVSTQDGETWAADAVVLATPAGVSARLVAPFAPRLAQSLSAMRYVSTATISLAYRQTDLSRALDGVGFLVPRREGRRISACTLSSAKFDCRAPDGQELLRVFIGGPGQEELADGDDEELVRTAREELAELAGLRAEPTLSRVYRWEKCNPQYDVGHLDWVREIQAECERVPGLFLTGSSYEGVGIPDCIRQAGVTAGRVGRYFGDRRET
jgi:protoporphyrinogen/coproporphyrinogen III oxidase